MSAGKRLRGVLIFVLFILAISWGVSVWFNKNQQEAKEEAASKIKTTARLERAKTELARLRTAWNADDSWVHQVYPANGDAPSYSLEVEHALVSGHPIIVVGEVQDVRTVADQSGPLVLIQSHRNPVDLRFSLATTPDVANSILSETHGDAMAEFKTFISVATIQSVEKIEPPPDKGGNEQDYFLAHGTLHEAYPTHLVVVDPKQLGEN